MKALKRTLVYGAVATAMGLGPVALAESGHGDKPHWGYEGEMGPFNWGGLSTDFKVCAAGKKQSPIDISTATVTTLSDIEVNYSEAPLEVVNNGHTVQVNFPEGNYINVAGTKYNLLQYHFHTTSEHTLGGKSFPLEAHLVHKTDDGKLGVIGVFMEEGDENKAIAAVWENMPKEPGTVKKDDVTINPAELLPTELAYFNYSGSLTTPPCSEGVNWMVMETPVQASSGQIEKFASIVNHNNRPVQPVNGRVVVLGN